MKKSRLVIITMLLLPLVAAFALAAFFYQSLPQQEGRAALPGLAGEVRVYRDAHGVPHVFAEKVDDAYAALGYLHAQDRLFQMEMMRRAATGRLAEILGADVLPYDRKMRAFGFAQKAESAYAALSAAARGAMDAYARGVNAFLAHGALPPEFALLGFKPSPWKNADGLLWAKLMALQLTGNWQDELFRESLLRKGWTKPQVLALYPPQDEHVPSVTRPLEWSGAEKAQSDAVALPLTILSATIPRNPFFENLPRSASNAYVIAAAHAKGGKPLLANDPHLQLDAPVLWYLAHLVAPGFEIMGASAPGLPFFPLGQTREVAWGFTTSNMDAADVVFVDAADGGLKPRAEIIHVKGASDETLRIEESADGVVLTGIVQAASDVTPPGKLALLQMTALQEGDRTAEALYRINHAHDAADIRAALADYHAPPQNLLYADSRGHMGYAAPGDVPQRAENHDGFFASENARWSGMMPQQSHPALEDPAAGVILSTNNAIVSAGDCAAFTCAMRRDWSEPYRAERLETLLRRAAAQGGLDAESAAQPMLDVTSAAAQELLPLLLAALHGGSEEEKEIIAALRAWNGAMRRDAPQPLIYNATLDALMRAEFGDVYLADATWPRLAVLKARLAAQPGDAAKIEAAFASALADLRKTYGAEWKKWRWGDAHRAPLAHPLWSKVPGLATLLDNSVAMDGDGSTLLRAAVTDYTQPFTVRHGAGYRAIYDLADMAASRFIIAGGQSAHPASPHYADMVGEWAHGAFISLAGSEAEWQQRRAKLLTLAP